MKAIEILRPGPPDVLQLCDRPIPQLKAGEVLIKVHAAGINRPDVIQRMGHYPVPPGASDLPGLEVAGEQPEVDAGQAKGKGSVNPMAGAATMLRRLEGMDCRWASI